MAASDSRPIPRKNTAFRAYFNILDADGDPVTGASSLDSEVSIDGAAFADCTSEATEIGSTGMYYLDLTAAEMNGDGVCVQVKTATSGAKTTQLVFYPEELGDIRADTVNERGKYAMGAVWIGPTANTNTVSYTDGIVTNPVSTIAAAKTIADALLLRRFFIIRSGTTQLGADMTNYDFEGDAWSLTTTGGSRDVSGSTFHSAAVIGGTFASTSASSEWYNCGFTAAVSVAAAEMHGCDFASTLTLNAAGDYDFIDCVSVVAGSGVPTFAVPSGTVNISFRRWSGGINITGITSGTTISIDVVSGGTVTLSGADGTVNIRGMVSGVTDNRTGSPTLNTTAVINQTYIATPTNITAGTIATVTTLTNKTGFALGATGLDLITTTDPAGLATTFPAMLVQVWRRFFKKSTLTATQLKTYNDDGTTVSTTQTVSDDGTTQTQGAAS